MESTFWIAEVRRVSDALTGTVEWMKPTNTNVSTTAKKVTTYDVFRILEVSADRGDRKQYYEPPDGRSRSPEWASNGFMAMSARIASATPMLMMV